MGVVNAVVVDRVQATTAIITTARCRPCLRVPIFDVGVLDIAGCVGLISFSGFLCEIYLVSCRKIVPSSNNQLDT